MRVTSSRQFPVSLLQLWCAGLAGLAGQVLLGVLLPHLAPAAAPQLGQLALPPPLRPAPAAGDPEQRAAGRAEAALHDQGRRRQG